MLISKGCFFTLKLFFLTMKLFSHNETNLGHNEIILLRKVSLWFASVKNRWVGVTQPWLLGVQFWYDETNLICKSAKSLVLSGFWQKEKERKYRINTCVPIWKGNAKLIQERFLLWNSEQSLARVSKFWWMIKRVQNVKL